jgi:hypothetical protein
MSFVRGGVHEDGAGGSEPRNHIDVAIGVVAGGKSGVEDNEAVKAKILADYLRDLCLSFIRVAIL